jgi:hypothetical protein
MITAAGQLSVSVPTELYEPSAVCRPSDRIA